MTRAARHFIASLRHPSPNLPRRKHIYNTMSRLTQHLTRRIAKACTTSLGIRTASRAFSVPQYYPPTHNATPARPPQGAMPMPFVTETVVSIHSANSPQTADVSGRRLAHIRYLLATTERTYHLPERRRRRSHLRIHRGSTPLPRSRRSTQAHQSLHQFARWYRDCWSRHLRHDDIYP